MERHDPADKPRLSTNAAPGGQRARKTDPAVYSQLRRQALEVQLPHVARDSVHVVLMDWHVDKGTVTVVAAADGSASLYLSTGGGYMGGSERTPAIREAALHAVALATSLRMHFEHTDTSPLPSLGDVTFYITTLSGVSRAVAAEARLRAGADPLAGLGGAMQRILTEYRLNSVKKPPNANGSAENPANPGA
ncbi:MAG: hypothetical protein ACLGXA_14580 [Acidobacteriota bacterium]